MPTKTKPDREPATKTTRSSYAFDADARAKKREDAPVTVGGLDLHRRRKNWTVSRQLRDLMQQQARAQVRVMRIRKKIEDLDLDAADDQIDELMADAGVAQDEVDEAAYRIIACLLATEDGDEPDLDHLKEHLDVDDAGDLANALAGAEEEVADPTSAAAATAATETTTSS